MHKKELAILAFALLLVSLLITVYFVQNIYSSTGRTVHSSVVNGLQLSLTLGAKTTTFKQGEGINVTLTLTNVSHQALNLSFISPDAYFEFDAYDSKNNFVMAKEDEGQFNTTITLAPERSITETFGWNTEYRGIDTPEGVYQLVGLVTEPDGQSVFRTTPLNVTIIHELSATPVY